MPRRSLAPAALALALLLHAGTASALTTLSLIPSRTTLEVGESLEVEILAEFSDPIVGWGLDLLVDPALLSVNGAPAIGPSWTSVAGADGDGLAGAAFPTGLTGEVLLATVILVADSEGLSMLSLAVTPNDPTEGFAYDPDFSSGFDTFDLPTPVAIHVTMVPEPSTAVLLALGVAGLGARRRRRPPLPR